MRDLAWAERGDHTRWETKRDRALGITWNIFQSAEELFKRALEMEEEGKVETALYLLELAMRARR